MIKSAILLFLWAFVSRGIVAEAIDCDCCKDKLDLEVVCQTKDLPPYVAVGEAVKQPGEIPLGDCTKLCATRENCVGINYSEDRKECELIMGKPTSFDLKADWNFYYVEKDPETEKIFTNLLKLARINGTKILTETTKFISEQITTVVTEKRNRVTEPPVKGKALLGNEAEEKTTTPFPNIEDLTENPVGQETLNLVKGSTEMRVKTSQTTNKTVTSVVVTTDNSTEDSINLGIVTENTNDGDETTILDMKEKAPCQSVEKIVTNTGVKLSDLQSFLDDAIKITRRKIKLLASMSAYIYNMCSFLHKVAEITPPDATGGMDCFDKVDMFTKSLHDFLQGKVNDTSQLNTKELNEWKDDIQAGKIKPVIDSHNMKKIEDAFKLVMEAIEKKMLMMEGKFKNISKLAESLFTE